MKRYRNLFFSLIGIMLALTVAVTALVVYVDPFFHYHPPIDGFSYIVDNQLSQNPGMAKNMLYDSCIIGSSMTVNFDTDDFNELLGLKTAKLSYSGAYPKDDSNILSIVFDKNTYARKNMDVKAVFIAADIPTMSADVDEIKYPLPEYLYDKNVLNDAEYVLNKDVLFEYILKPVIQGKGSDLSEIYFSWWTPDYYNIQWVMHNYEQPEEAQEKAEPDSLIPATKANLDTNILPYVEANPDTEFYFFFPPYSILYWNNVIRENMYEATMNQYMYVTNRLLEYDNVHLFYFQDIDEVLDLNNYADYSHYKPEINRFMVECFKDGSHEIHSEEEMAKELSKMDEMVTGFDFMDLFSQEW